MKKILALLLALVMALSLCACSKKVDPAKDYENIVEAGEMVIGMTLFAPMNYYDTDKTTLIGFETEFAQAVCAKLGENGVKAKFVEIDWSAKETELNSGNIDCIWNGMTIDDERKTNMSISVPYMSNRQVLVMKADAAATLASADGLKVAAEAGSAGEKVVKEDKYFANAELVSVKDMATALMEVKSGTVDACVIDYVTSLGMIGAGTSYADFAVVENAKFEIGNDEQYGIAFRKGSNMTEKVNAVIAELYKDGTLAKIAAKYKLEDQLIAQ